MRALQATINSKGQVTIPAVVRRALGVGPSDTIVFELEDTGEVRLVPMRCTVESSYGAVPAIGREDDLKAISREAREDRATDVVRSLAHSRDGVAGGA